jgi:hypothetical protein
MPSNTGSQSPKIAGVNKVLSFGRSRKKGKPGRRKPVDVTPARQHYNSLLQQLDKAKRTLTAAKRSVAERARAAEVGRAELVVETATKARAAATLKLRRARGKQAAVADKAAVEPTAKELRAKIKYAYAPFIPDTAPHPHAHRPMLPASMPPTSMAPALWPVSHAPYQHARCPMPPPPPRAYLPMTIFPCSPPHAHLPIPTS